jgi:hypothetical protein
MGKPKRIIIDDNVMNQKEALEYFRKEYINKMDICVSIKVEYPELYERLLTILCGHPNKVDKGIVNEDGEVVCKDFFITRNTNGDKEINVKKEDGSVIDISWSKAIKEKVSSNKENLIRAMRSSIEEQIEEFRNENPDKTCKICNQITTEKELNIDHEILFKTLTDNFLKKYKEDERPKEFDIGGRNEPVFKNINNNFKEAWNKYHKNNAILRWSHKSCNLERKKNQVLTPSLTNVKEGIHFVHPVT